MMKTILPYNDLLDKFVNKINRVQNNSKSLSEQIGKKDKRIQVFEQINSNQQTLLDGLDLKKG